MNRRAILHRALGTAIAPILPYMPGREQVQLQPLATALGIPMPTPATAATATTAASIITAFRDCILIGNIYVQDNNLCVAVPAGNGVARWEKVA